VELRHKLDEAVQTIKTQCQTTPKIGIILGTGLGSLSDVIEEAVTIKYNNIPHFPTSTADSHAGDLILGKLSGKSVLAMSGRFHMYEGYSQEQITFPIRVAKALGIHTLIISNAAGGMNPLFDVGDLMVITDHINFMGDNPLIGPNDDSLGPRFPDMSEPYSWDLIKLAESLALDLSLPLKRGVYLGCPGPSLETRAEYRFMRMLGADAVGMSTVPEVIVAVHAGLKVLGFSAITDSCLPDALQPANIKAIIATANAVEPNLTKLVLACIEKMD